MAFRLACRKILQGGQEATGGNVALLMALSLFALFACAGAAIDYSRYVRETTIYATAADAAVLAATSAAKEASESGIGDPEKLGIAAGNHAFAANSARSDVLKKSDPVITLKDAGSGWTVALNYKVAVPTTFMSIFGIRTMKIDGKAGATGGYNLPPPDYWDFHLVADTSSSMGLGATASDMKGMENKFRCAFACHTQTAVLVNFHLIASATPALANAAGYKLRIDIVDQAFDALTAEISSWGKTRSVRAALWGMNNDADSLVPLTSKLDSIRQHKIDMALEKVKRGHSNFELTLKTLSGAIGASGAGRTADAPRKAVFIVTDGMQDARIQTSNYVTLWGTEHYIGPIGPASCDALKSAGVLVGVLYIDYYVPAGYEQLLSPTMPDVLPNLKACATKGLFFNASTPAGITQALSDMFKKAITMNNPAVRLTN